MNKLMTIVAAGVLAASMAFAQASGPGGGKNPAQGGQQGQKGGMRRMMGAPQDIIQKLNLSAQQKAKIEALNKSTREQVEKLRANAGKNQDRDAMRAKMKPIFENYRKQFNAILTPAQRAQYEKLMKERMEQFRKNGGQRGAPPKGGAGGKGGGKTSSPPPVN